MTYKPSRLFSIRIQPWGLLTAAGAVASAATVMGFCGRLSWFLDLFFHFRVQYLLGLVVLGVILIAGRRRKTAILFLALAIVNAAVVLPLYFGKQPRPSEARTSARALLIIFYCAYP
ncbi:MAG: hypothetical protein LC725_00570 [Lentisphaerae bacterium]|nr:hypothetical protein [Lentisphaerota bacterium]